MFNNLNASGFGHSISFYNAEFEDVFSKIITCYHLMLDDKVSLVNDENEIRNILLVNYLKDNDIRNKIGLTDYLFDREVPEDRTIGRTDIKIQTANTFTDTNAYYIIECKRLDSVNADGKTGLNAKYVENGVCRFTSKYYSCHYKINGMIGFVVEPIDMSNNIKSINNLLTVTFATVTNTIDKLYTKKIHNDFEHSYCSTHKTNENTVLIYHLMFDFSKNIVGKT